MHNLKYTFALFIFALNCSARELSVINHNLKYTLSFDEKMIHYKTTDTELSLKKEACNEHIIKRFKAEMDQLLKDPFPNQNNQEFFELTLDGTTLYSPRFGERALFLMNMHQEIKKIKTEESFNCSKKTK